MKNLLARLLGLATSLTVFANATPLGDGAEPYNLDLTANSTKDPTNMLGDDPSFDYHDYSLIQTWVGKDKVTVGTVIGPQLYSIVWDLLNVGCRPVVSNTCVNDATNICFQTTAMDKYPGGPKYSWTCLGGLRMEWRTSEIRKLLIGAVAGTLEALTLNQVGGDSN